MKPTIQNTVKRPKKPPLRTELIMLRVTAAQYRHLLRAAKRTGLELAVLCRTLVLEGIEQGRESRLRGISSTDAQRKGETVSPAASLGETGT